MANQATHPAPATSPATILERSWRVWAERVRAISPEQLRAPTRLGGWTVHDLLAHITPDADQLAALMGAVQEGPAAVADGSGVLRAFNQPGGVAETMAPSIEQTAIETAPGLTPADAAHRFERSADLVASAPLDPQAVIPYPGVGSTTVGAVTDIAIVETTVHALDLIAAIGGTPPPAEAVAHTRDVLARVADPVALIEVLTGRADPATLLPVVR